MKQFLNASLYIILISALIPSTQLLLLTFLGIATLISRATLELKFFLALSCMVLGLCGYAGFLLLLNGLHRTNRITKLILLLCGLIGGITFVRCINPATFIDWLLDFSIDSLIGKWPLIVSLFFSGLIVNDLIRNKTLANNIDKKEANDS